MTYVYTPVPVPCGIYSATIVSIAQTQTQHGEAIKWTFSIISDDPDINGKDISQFTGNCVSSKSRIKRWLDVFGIDTTPGKTIDIDSLLNQEVLIQVTIDGKFNKAEIVGRPKLPSKKTKSPGLIVKWSDADIPEPDYDAIMEEMMKQQ